VPESSFLGLPVLDLTGDLDDVNVAVIGLAFDDGIGYGTGAREGPLAARDASAALSGPAEGEELDALELLHAVDLGDVHAGLGDPSAALTCLSDALAALPRRGLLPMCLGGDHLVALAELRALAASYGPVSLVLLDSHPDTSDRFAGSGLAHCTPFRRAVEEGLVDPHRSVMCGLRGTRFLADTWEQAQALGYQIISASDAHRLGVDAVAAEIAERCGDRPVFLSFDVDFLDPTCAPGTGCPEVGGFSVVWAERLLRELRPLHVVGADVVELLPRADRAGLTAAAAARVGRAILAMLAAAG